MDDTYDGIEGYGRFENTSEVRKMRRLDYKGKINHIKELWQEDPEKYYEWKAWCIARNRLPDFFGTRDDPIPIDESKL